jgi:hypothetical protein
MSHMNQPAITIIINNKTYSLSAGNVEAIRRIPDADRQQLIALLELVKQQESAAPVREVTTEVNSSCEKTSSAYNAGNPRDRSERLASGDIDSLMAQLIMEERAKENPGITKQSIYKWVVGVAVVVIFLVLVL